MVTNQKGGDPDDLPRHCGRLADVLVSSLDLLRTPTYSGPRVMHERPAEEGLAPSAGALPPTWRRLKPQVMAEQSVAMGKFRPVKVERQMEAGRKARGPWPASRIPYPATGSVDTPAVAPAGCPAGLPNGGPGHANTRHAGSERAAA